MRIFFTLLYSSAALLAHAQEAQTVSEGIIKTTTEFYTRQENLEEADNRPFLNTSFRFGLQKSRDGSLSMQTTTYFKNDMAATVIKSNARIITHIRNFTAGATYSFKEYEMYRPHGSIYVSYIGDTSVQAELEAQNKNWRQLQKDSIEIPQVKVYYQDMTKTIAGYPCKRAVVYLLYSNGRTGKINVWYNEAIKLKYIASTGDPNYLTVHKYIGVPANQFNLLSAVKGFPMEYEMKFYKDTYITVTVTQLNVKKRVRDSLFRFPYDHQVVDYEQKPVKRYVEEPAFNPIVSDPSKVDN